MKMAELLPSEVPLKKRKVEAAAAGLAGPCSQEPASLLSPSALLLQIPPCTNTSLPVWDHMRAAQVEALWSVTPYGITVQITPLTSQKTSSKAVSVTRSLSVPVPASQNSSVSDSVRLLFPSVQSQDGSLTQSWKLPDLHTSVLPRSQPTLTSQTQTLGLTMPVTTVPPQPVAQPPLSDLLFELAPKAEWVQQACFYTRPSEDISICDRFLLGCCQNGFECKLHHTPYPFHWQLRRRDTHQWVSTSHAAQVKLEKLYCDIDRDSIQLQHMEAHFTLHFDTMSVPNSEKYDIARRLSNSSDPERNPSFPTQWITYWWNDYQWEKYKQDPFLNVKAGESSCQLHIGRQVYEVDFNSLTQRNVTTGFIRRVRRRPTFRSPVSLKLHLKTVVLGDASQHFGQDLSSLNVDPLQEFSSWYPPVWTLTPDQGYSLVEVPPNTKAYQSIHSMFHQTMSENKVEIISIQQVQNVFQWDKYQRQKQHMQSRSPDQAGSLERHLFHGTTEDSAKEICQNNFDPRVSGKNGVVYGQGSYFARDASYSDKYAHISGDKSSKHMFLAKVLVGKMTVGRTKFCRPPRLHPRKPGFELFDSCVDLKKDPSIFVVFDSCQSYPYYLITYEAVSDTVKIFE
ncbi:hypothetical protein AGOR_G00186430 [Albula goreensis]|uniref:Uncharacterized protein n=1 Tax=Albula goreensis TaxID=1534307 RepID=A0A8T3CXU1_9TELE|nr:hypothetical protein AGOR_G00186430 [Albula goreensis]